VRSFLAVVPPREARDKVEAVRDPLRDLAPGARWVHPSLWHLTLKFLGEVEDELIPAVADLVGMVTAEVESFEIVLGGFGLFPNADRPRTFWIGIMEGAEPLLDLAHRIDLGLDGLGFEPEETELQAHMTLARLKDWRDADPLREHLGEPIEVCRFEVGSVKLMKSVLRPRGPDYTVIEKLRLISTNEEEEEPESDDDVEATEDE